MFNNYKSELIHNFKSYGCVHNKHSHLLNSILFHVHPVDGVDAVRD